MERDQSDSGKCAGEDRSEDEVNGILPDPFPRSKAPTKQSAKRLRRIQDEAQRRANLILEYLTNEPRAPHPSHP
jgi:hypothetical protein